MIRHPGQVINAGLVIDPATVLPAIDGFDLALSTDNVVAFGGDVALYRHFLARGLRALGAKPVGTAVLAVASLAAWRAGVLELRPDALTRISDAPPACVASALGVDPVDLEAFVRAQESNRFAWPGTPAAEQAVALVGGFRGLGGAFVSPPLSASPLARDGGFAIHTAADDWEYDADIFGGRLSKVPTPGPVGDFSGAQLTVSATSYLATLVLAS